MLGIGWRWDLMVVAVRTSCDRSETKVSTRLAWVSYRSEQFTSAAVKRRVFGSADQSGADQTLDRAAAVPE